VLRSTEVNLATGAGKILLGPKGHSYVAKCYTLLHEPV